MATWSLVAFGAVLRLWQFAGGASLYLDEVSIGRNITERSYRALLAPLDYAQVAPPGWLLVERFLWTSLGTDWSLRLISIVAALWSLLLFRAVARRVLRGVALPFAMGCFAPGVPFLLYGAIVKSYSLDVALTFALQLMALRLLDTARDGALADRSRARIPSCAGTRRRRCCSGCRRAVRRTMACSSGIAFART